MERAHIEVYQKKTCQMQMTCEIYADCEKQLLLSDAREVESLK